MWIHKKATKTAAGNSNGNETSVSFHFEFWETVILTTSGLIFSS